MAAAPRHRGDLPGANAVAEDVNPLCGDRVRLMLTVEPQGRIAAARFVGDSCAICTASADVLAELVSGRSRSEAAALEGRRRARRLAVGDPPHADALRDPSADRAGQGAERRTGRVRLDEQTRGDFPILQRVVSGHQLVLPRLRRSSQKPRAVIEAMSEYYERSHANVHRSIHTLGEEATSSMSWPATPSSGSSARRAGRGRLTRGTTDGLGFIAETSGRTSRRATIVSRARAPLELDPRATGRPMVSAMSPRPSVVPR